MTARRFDAMEPSMGGPEAQENTLRRTALALAAAQTARTGCIAAERALLEAALDYADALRAQLAGAGQTLWRLSCGHRALTDHFAREPRTCPSCGAEITGATR